MPDAAGIRANKLVVAEQIGAVNVYSGEPAPTVRPGDRLPPYDPRFVGRARELEALHAALQQAAPVGLTQPAAAHGEGGIGKTALAVHYAWTHRDSYPAGIWWLSGDTALLIPALADLAACVGAEPADNDRATALAVRRHLEQHEDAGLLIIDDVSQARWTDPTWNECLPTCGPCRVLVTTREPELDLATMVAVHRLSRAEGIQLLARERKDAAEPANEAIVGAIVEWFAGMPVALTVVAAYTRVEPGATWPSLQRHLESKNLGAVRAMEVRTKDQRQYRKRLDSLFGDLLAWLTAAEQVTLEYAALLPNDVVPLPWLAWLLGQDADAALGEAMPGYDEPTQPALDHLVARQLLTPVEPEPVHSLHRLLGAFVRERLAGDPARRERRLAGLVALGEYRGEASRGAVTDRSLRWELSPLLALSQVLVSQERPIAAATVANWVQEPLRALARYAEVRASLERFVTADGHALGADGGEQGAIVLNHYAALLKDLGDMAGARARIEQALSIDEKRLPADSPSLASHYSNLAVVLQDLGDLAGARARMEQAIAIDEQRLPANSPMLAIRYSNLAMVLKDLGDLAGARAHMEQALAIDEKHWPADHPTLAIRYSNLAMVLRGLGEMGGARARMEQAIAIDEKHFAADHPMLAICYSNLATVLHDLDDLSGARARMEQAIAIDEKHFAADHPILATRHSNLGAVLWALGELPAARKAFEHALAIARARLGPDHPRTRRIAGNLAVLNHQRPPQ